MSSAKVSVPSQTFQQAPKGPSSYMVYTWPQSRYLEPLRARPKCIPYCWWMISYTTLSPKSPRNYNSLGALSGARFPPPTVLAYMDFLGECLRIPSTGLAGVGEIRTTTQARHQSSTLLQRFCFNIRWNSRFCSGCGCFPIGSK